MKDDDYNDFNGEQSLMEIYLRSRAIEFSKLFKRITAMTLELLGTQRLSRRRLYRAFNPVKNHAYPIILSAACIMSLASAVTMMGILEDLRKPAMELMIHTGYWDRIPANGVASKTFEVENPTGQLIYLELLSQNWFPVSTFRDVEITWDYDGVPLRAGESREVTITIENYNPLNTLFVSLDIYIIGNAH